MSESAERWPIARESMAWAAAVLVAGAVLASFDYWTRDSDSILYATIAANLAEAPLARWIAPEWPGQGGPFREHPVGIFLLPALLAKLGYPAFQAAYWANAVYQALILLLIPQLASAFVAGREARALAWMLQLMPIAFVFRVRANQEPAVLLCLLIALFGCERSQRAFAWAGLTAAGLVAMLLVKGVLAVLGPAVCAGWLIARRRATGEVASKAWLGLALGIVAMAAAAVSYEWAYRRVSGQPFLTEYLGRQLGIAAVQRSDAPLAEKLANLGWYASRILWFAFPWSLAALGAAWSYRSRRDRALASGLAFGLGVAALYLLLFSLSDRRADRYVFPAYYALGACGAVAALRGERRFRDLSVRWDAVHPLAPVGLWLGAFGLHLIAGRFLQVPTIKL